MLGVPKGMGNADVNYYYYARESEVYDRASERRLQLIKFNDYYM